MSNQSAGCSPKRNALTTALLAAMLGMAPVYVVNAQQADGGASQTAEKKIHFNIPAQSAATALNAFAEQADITLIFSTEDVHGISLKGIQGDYVVSKAIQRLLGHAPLQYRQTSEGSWAVKSARPDQHNSDSDVLGISVAKGGKEEAARSARDLDAITVIGTRIRGINNPASSVITISRLEIERSGYTSVQRLLDDLPQNFSGSTDTMNQGYHFDSNVVDSSHLQYGAAANLRGLGPESTLVLLNGRRLARSGTDTVVDISLIPMGAVESIEIMTDGASAIYGADAVGGVINIVTRKGFTGGEIVIRKGKADSSSHEQSQRALLLGKSWSRGSIMLGGEITESTPMLVGERYKTRGRGHAVEEGLLIPPSEKRNAIIYSEYDLSDAIRLDAELTQSRRSTRGGFIYDPGVGFPYYSDAHARVESQGVGMGITAQVGRGWQIKGNLGRDRNDNALDLYNGFLPENLEHSFTQSNRGSVLSYQVIADGEILRLNDKAIRVAVGFESRNETMRVAITSPTLGYSEKADREVKAIFSEVHIPLLAKNEQALDVSVAGRLEEYNDFGRAFSPKVSLAWRPNGQWTVNAVTGRSFRAPSMQQMTPISSGSMAIGWDAGNVLYWNGTKEGLRAETSRNWSIGFNYASSATDGFKASLNIYDIDFRNRIGSPIPPGMYEGDTIGDPGYSSIVTAAPDPAVIAELLELMYSQSSINCFTASGSYCDPFDYSGSIDYLVDTRTTNVSRVRQKGVDFLFQYNSDYEGIAWGVAISGNKLFNHYRQFLNSAQKYDLLDRVFYPAGEKAVLKFNASSDAWALGIAVKHTGSYADGGNRTVGNYPRLSRVDSWTTVDLSASLELERIKPAFLREFSLMMNVGNVFNKAPPYVAHTSGLTYDPNNANAIGRLISIALKLAW